MKSASCQSVLDETFFTIVIPTRERCDTLVYCIQTALSLDYTNYEILVSDNCSQDSTRDIVYSFGHERIKYINTGSRVSMSENWEFALNHIKDGWVTVIGDDDAILPSALKIVNDIIKTTEVQAVRSNGASYSWPSLNGEDYGKLSVSLRDGYEIRTSGHCLQKVLNGYMSYNQLPMLYNGGFVSKCLIDKAKQETGKMFMSMIPDVYTAVVFSFLAKKYVYCHAPLAINGASQHSGGTAAFERVKRARSYDPAAKFNSENNLPIHRDIPSLDNKLMPRCIPIIVYESFLQASQFYGYNRAVNTSPSKQLRLALSVPNPDNNEVLVWAKLFAAQNKLRIPGKHEILLKRLLLRLRSKFTIAAGPFQSISIYGNSSLPLTDVYQAAIAAGAITAIKPSLIKTLKAKLRRLWKTQASRAKIPV